MFTDIQTNLKSIIKNSIHSQLKPIGFKKKGNNFYRRFQNFGQVINIQSDRYNTKEEGQFRINTGIFSDSYWLKFYNYKNVKNVPDFPKEYVCILRQTFGEITNRGDFWYELNRHEDSQSLIVKNDFEKILIPYFENLKSELKILEVLETEDAPPHIKNLDWERLHFYLKFNNKVKAKETYHKMLKETFFLTARNRIIEDYKEYDFLSNR
jgi:hypothetical protein